MFGPVMISRVKSPPNPTSPRGGGGGGGSHVTMIGALLARICERGGHPYGWSWRLLERRPTMALHVLS